jgi:hypothetical protein
MLAENFKEQLDMLKPHAVQGSAVSLSAGAGK